MRKKTFDVVFISIFVLMLIIPLAFVDLSGGAISERENRVLAARPPMSYALEWPSDFIKQFDAWIADNVGFRENLIEFFKLLDTVQGPTQHADGSLVGQGGHLFYANERMISKYQGRIPYNPDELTLFAASLQKIKGYLDEREIPLIVMLCADKESVYPEYYPKSIMRGSEPIILDVTTTYLKDNTDIDVFNIRKSLMDAKKEYLVYNKAAGDLAHYNEVGAFFAYSELMSHIKAYMPEMESLTINEINIAYNEGDCPVVSLKEEPAFTRLDKDFFDGVALIRPFSWENAAFINENTNLPTLLLFRDSYSGFNYRGTYYLTGNGYTGNEELLTRYLPQHFGKTILIHYLNLEHFKEYIDSYEPDMVVFQVSERQLEVFVQVAGNYQMP